MHERSLAQEAVSWYLSHVEDCIPHAENVKRFFRGPVIALTISILKNERLEGQDAPQLPDGGVACQAPNANGAQDKASRSNAPGANWKDYLSQIKGTEALPDFSENDQKDYESLSDRAKTRLEAFLLGVALALPSEDLTSSPDRKKIPSRLVSTSSYSNVSSASSSFAENQRQLPGSGYASTNSSANSFGLIEGLAGFKSLEKGPSSFIRSMSSSRHIAISKRPQMTEQDMVTRLELYLRSLHRVKSLGRDCVVEAEPMRAVHARAQAIVASFIDTVSTVRQQGPVLTRLLTTTTKELMAVDLLSEGLSRVIRRIVSDYEHTTSFASLAFLSSPENAADEKLTPMVIKYLRYLQANWKNCETDCGLERMLSTCLDPKMRRTFKTVEFRSIGHLLEVCQSFRGELQHIEFPPTCYTTSSSGSGTSDKNKNRGGAIDQAIRDLRREVITVNGNVLPPVTSHAELIQLLSQTLNSRSLTALPMRKSSRRRRRKSRHSRTDSAASHSSADMDNHSFVSSGSDGDVSETTAPSSEPSRALSPHGSYRRFKVDFLTKRLLLAASRTGTGGDAYFVVRDLFGGHDVEVVPSAYLPGQTRRETIEILVRLASVTIRCHGSFDVYPKSLVGTCEPLIQVHTTTSETISLQEMRASDSSGELDQGLQQEYTNPDDEAPMIMVVQERITEKTGWRTLSVRPALYERIEVWNTPS